MGTVSHIVNSITGRDQQQAANDAAQAQAQQANAQQARINPYINLGTNSLNQLSSLAGQPNNITPFSFNPSTDPAYQANLQAAMDAARAGSAGMGNFGSGNMLSALQQNASNLASQEYQNQFSNWLNTQNLNQQARLNQINPLMQLAQLGQNSALGVGSQLLNSASNAGDMYMQGANAVSQGTRGLLNSFNPSSAMQMGSSALGSLSSGMGNLIMTGW